MTRSVPIDMGGAATHPAVSGAPASMIGFERVHEAWTRAWERWATDAIIARLPAWVLPDHLTAIGLAGGGLAGFCYTFSTLSRWFLLGAMAGVLLNWLGDSVDGNLARARGTERPRYGFFIDHSSDVLAQLCIFLGIGASPYAHMVTACMALLAYWMATLLSLITTVVTRQFRISYGGVGPTEVRLAVLGGTLLHLLAGPIVLAHARWGAVSLVDTGFVASFVVAACVYVRLMRAIGRRLLHDGAIGADAQPAP